MTNKDRFMALCKDNISRPGMDRLLEWLEKSDFFTAPASTRFHGNYEGGLLEHSLNVFDCLVKIAERYPDYETNLESITICALFHDICKANFYKKGSRNVKDPDTGKWFSKEIWEIDETFPIGHGAKSCIILQWFLAYMTVDELLAIRWHMGEFDSAVKGGDRGLNKAWDEHKLGVMLHMADMEASHLIDKMLA